MRKYVFIGIGAFFGSILRYIIKTVQIFGYSGGFPLNTFIINITGSFVLAFLITFFLEIKEIDTDIRVGITVGFLGGYTTFSAFCKETVMLLHGGDYFATFLYMALSILAGIGVSYLGIAAARKVGYKVLYSEDEL